MKPQPYISHRLLWSAMVFIIAGVLAASVFTNTTLRSIEKNIPSTLLTELNDLSSALENLGEVVTAAHIARSRLNADNFQTLRGKVDAAYDDIVALRESYVFDNLVRASAFHAVVAPAIADLRIWLSDGVSGYAPESQTTINIALTRVQTAYTKARALTRKSKIRAQEILEEQRTRLDRFLFMANLLFILTIVITSAMVYLLIRQYHLQKREMAVQAELLNQRDLMHNLFENIPLGIIVWDGHGVLMHANKGFTDITGYSQRDIKNLEDWFSQAYPDPEYREQVTSDWNSVPSTGRGSAEFKVTRKDGGVRDIEFNGVFLKDGRALVTLADITARKRAARELRRQEEINARSKKMESLGLLAGGVAHDLNNILSGIVSYPELLLMEIPQDSPFRKPIETIHESGLRAAAIVQDLLTVARGAAVAKEPLNLNDLINAFLNSHDFKNLKQHHGQITVNTRLDKDLFNILGSSVHLRKVLMNLMVNAAEAIEGQGVVTVETVNRYLDRPFRGYDHVKSGEYAVLAITDTGSGISSEDIERIFEPFYTKKVMGRSGTGLGLAVVWNVVQDHAGYIHVKNRSEGATFELYFPITRAEITVSKKSRTVHGQQGKGEQVLVVDDEPSQRDIFQRMLQKLGYHAVLAESGEEAVEYLKTHRVDLVLLDMIMDPGMNGRQTYEKIIAIHPGQKAVIASGFAENEEVKKAQQLGAGKFLKKPLTLEQLASAVKEVLTSLT